MTEELVRVDMLVPRELKDNIASFVSKHNKEYFSSTEFWIRAATAELERLEIEERILGGL